jgi:hypothetical protein
MRNIDEEWSQILMKLFAGENQDLDSFNTWVISINTLLNRQGIVMELNE